MTWGNRTPKVRSGEDLVRFAGLRRWACACRRASRRPESATNQKNRAVLWVTGERLNFFGGEGGIRTLDTGLSPYNALAGRHLRPLGHLSVFDLSYQCCQHCPAIRVTRGRQVAPSQRIIYMRQGAYDHSVTSSLLIDSANSSNYLLLPVSPVAVKWRQAPANYFYFYAA